MGTKTLLFRCLVLMLAILVQRNRSQNENSRFSGGSKLSFCRTQNPAHDRCATVSSCVRTLALLVAILLKFWSEIVLACEYVKRLCSISTCIFKMLFLEKAATKMKIGWQRTKNEKQQCCREPHNPADNALLCYEFRFKAKGFHIPRELCLIADDAQLDAKMPIGSERRIYPDTEDVDPHLQTFDSISAEQSSAQRYERIPRCLKSIAVYACGSEQTQCVTDHCVREHSCKDAECGVSNQFCTLGSNTFSPLLKWNFHCPYFTVHFICHFPYFDDVVCGLYDTASSFDSILPCTSLKKELGRKLKETDMRDYLEQFYCCLIVKSRKLNLGKSVRTMLSLYTPYYSTWHVRPLTRFLPDATHNPDIDLAHVGYRLATLSALPPSVPVSRVRLAEAGFYYRGQGDEMICFRCQVRHSGWTSRDNPLEVHRQLSPNCPHVLERSREITVPSLYQGTGGSVSGQQQHASNLAAVSESRSSRSSVAGITAGIGNISVSQNQGQTAQAQTGSGVAPTVSVPVSTPTQISESHGSSQHSQSTPQGASASFPAQASHNFAGISTSRIGGSGPGAGRTTLTSTVGDSAGGLGGGARANRGTSADVPSAANVSATATSAGGPSCPRIGLMGGAPSASAGYDHPDESRSHRDSNPRNGAQSRATGDVGRGHSVSNQRGSVQGSSEGGASARQLFPRAGLDLGGAVYPMYQDMASRRRSFESWDERRVPPLDQIILCGMFYAGYADCVRCFYCGVGLKHWEPTDDVWAEHIRWRPTCGYLRAIKGDDYIRRTQARLAREGENEEDSELGVGGGTGNGSGNIPAVPAPVSTNQLQNTPSTPRETTAPPSVTPPVISPPSVSILSTPSSQTTSVPATVASAQISVSSTSRLVTTPAASVTSSPSMTTCATATSQSGPATAAPASGGNNSSGSSTVPDRVERPSSQAPSDESHAQRVARLQAENLELARRLRCKVCHREPIDTLIMPCGHLVVCDLCARTVTQCPLCHGRIRATAKVHMN